MNLPLNQSTAKFYLLLAFGAVCVSFAPVFVKMIVEDVLGPTAIGFWRLFLGAIILFGWSVAAGHKIRISARMMKWTALAGAIFFLDLFLWHRSIIYAGAGMATILANTQVFWTAILSFFIFKEKLSLKFFSSAIAAIIGVALLAGYGSEIEFSLRYIEGVLFGLATGIVYANYLVTLKVAGQREDRPHFVTLVAWVSLFGAVILGLSGWVESDPFLPPDGRTWLVLIALAVVAQALGWWAIASGLPRIDISKGGLILLLQPVLATVWGFFLFSEYLTWIQLIGAVVTLTAIYVGSTRTRRS